MQVLHHLPLLMETDHRLGSVRFTPALIEAVSVTHGQLDQARAGMTRVRERLLTLLVTLVTLMPLMPMGRLIRLAVGINLPPRVLPRPVAVAGGGGAGQAAGGFEAVKDPVELS